MYNRSQFFSVKWTPSRAQCPRSCANRPDFQSVSPLTVLYPINGGYADIKMASDTANAGAFFEHAYDFPTLIIGELVLAAKFHTTFFRSRATFLCPIANKAVFNFRKSFKNSY